MNDRLKQSDAALGNFQRNVGNYKSGFSGLSNSVNQITREFPAFANSLQTGFMAISNNFPIFFDQIKATKTELAAMRAEGQKVPSLFQALTSSIFSWGTALSLGVTLLTVYGGDIVKFIGSAFKAKETLDQTAASQKILNDALAESSGGYQKALTDVNELTINIDLAKKGLISKKDVLKQYNESIGKVTGEVKTLDQAEQELTKNGPKYIQMMLFKAAANLALQEAAKKAFEAEQIRLKSEREFATATTKTAGQITAPGFVPGLADPVKQAAQRQAEAKKIKDKTIKEAENDANTFKNIAAKFQKQAAEISKSSNFKFFGDEFDDKNKTQKDKYGEQIKNLQEALQRNAELQISAQEQLLSEQRITEDSFLLTKYNITKAYVDKSIQYEESRGKKKDESKILELKKRTQDAYNEFLEAYTKAEKEAREEDAKLTKEQLEKRNKEAIDAIEDEKQLQLIALQEGRDLAINSKILTDKERAGLELEYQNKIDEITIDALRARSKFETDEKKKENEKLIAELQAKINSRQAESDSKAAKDASADKLKALELEATLYQRLYDQINRVTNNELGASLLRILYMKRFYEAKKKAAKDDAERERIKHEEDLARLASYQDAVMAAVGEINGIFSRGSEYRISVLEAEKQRELDNAGNNASAREKIEKEYNKKIAAEKTKQAKAEKIFTLFSIAINTAAGIMQSIKTLGLPLATPFIVATSILGATQAALVASRPIPKYKKGRKRGPAEAAIVDEIGSELIVDKHGKLREIGTNKGPRVTYLNKDDQVIPAHEKESYLTKMIFNHRSSKIDKENQIFRSVVSKIESAKQVEAINVMANAIKNGGISESAMQGIMEKAFSKIVIERNIWDERGYRKRIEDINNRTTYLNDLSKF